MRILLRASTFVCATSAVLALPMASAAGAAVTARQATAGPLAAASSTPSLLQVGSRGPQVRDWQALLNRIFREGAVTGTTVNEDGVFGPATSRATRTVQAHLRLSQDGVVGPRTQRAVSELGAATGVGSVGPGSSAQDTGRRLSAGMRGADVREWQRILTIAIDLDRLEHPRVGRDGMFGPQTRSATVALQRTLKITPDGVVGPTTRQATGFLLEG